MSKRQRKIQGRFVPLPVAILDARAWRAMNSTARVLWIELRRKLRHGGLNNGKIWLACRPAAKAIGASKDTVAHRFVELEHYGFLRKTAEGFLGVDGRGIAAKYRFTDLAYGTHPPTRDFEKWDGELFVYAPRRAARKKQKPILTTRTPRPKNQDIRKAGNGGSVCPTAPDIGAASDRPKNQDISRLPLHTAPVEQDQGSSTARAPAVAHAAGGAGSSPAPDAEPAEPSIATNGVNARRKHWSTPTVEEIPWDALPTEMRMLALGVSAPDLAPEGAPVAALETFRVSHPDAARYAVVLQNMREQRGDAAANAEMVWELGNTAMVPPGEIQRELERIQRLAGPSVHRRAPLDPTNTMEKR